MAKVIELKSKKKLSNKEDNKEIHKLNLKLSYIAELTSLINAADNREFDKKLYEGISHRVCSMNGEEYIVTLTKVKNDL